MGVEFSQMAAWYEYSPVDKLTEYPRQVLALAEKSVAQVLAATETPQISHLITATSCPDMLAPSLGQMLTERYHSNLSQCQAIDMVQGCAGGVSAMILGSQLAELNKSSVLVIKSDAARKATSESSELHKVFGNGSFACLITYTEDNKRLIHSRSRQYAGLSEVVTIKLGHDADAIIRREIADMSGDQRQHLGLSMNNSQAMALLSHAEGFYQDFVRESEAPDMMILHQANPVIVRHLEGIFSKYEVEFINTASLAGNCGAATVGIALHHVWKQAEGKKVLLCSYGTGGMITAGLWQF